MLGVAGVSWRVMARTCHGRTAPVNFCGRDMERTQTTMLLTVIRSSDYLPCVMNTTYIAAAASLDLAR